MRLVAKMDNSQHLITFGEVEVNSFLPVAHAAASFAVKRPGGSTQMPLPCLALV
jgi:hypothetical protein